MFIKERQRSSKQQSARRIRTKAPPQPPSQERSRETLERILTATEELLEYRLFEQVALTDVARLAGYSVGTIYTRFRDKEAILPALFERHDAGVAPQVEALVATLSKESGLRERIECVVAFAVDYHWKRRGLLRALTMYVRARPNDISGTTFDRRLRQYRMVAEAVAGDCRGIQHSDPVGAAEFALGVINSVCREQILFEEVTPLRGRRPSLKGLKRRIVDMVHRDLAGTIRGN